MVATTVTVITAITVAATTERAVIPVAMVEAVTPGVMATAIPAVEGTQAVTGTPAATAATTAMATTTAAAATTATNG
jgi:hypothetical protein